MVRNAQLPNRDRPAIPSGSVRFAGLACLIGGALWAVLVIAELLDSTPSIVSDLLLPIPMLLGMACGPLILLICAARSVRMRLTGIIGASVSLLGIGCYLAAALSTYIVGQEVEIFYPAGALLLGVGMLTQGIAAFVARWMPGWRRVTPLIVGLYYIAMIPFQIVFFIIPDGEPSSILLGIWSAAWVLFGYAVWSSASSFAAGGSGKGFEDAAGPNFQ